MILQHTLTLDSVKTVATDTKLFRFLRPKDFSFQAGQFFSVQFNKTTARAYSIASTPDDKYLELIIRIIPEGFGSKIMNKTLPGTKFNIKGPFGMFVLSKNESAELVFCGTGTGIAPLRSMILAETKKQTPRPMTLLYGGRNAEDLAYLDEIASWSPGLKIYLGLSQDPDKKVPQNPDLEKTAIHGRITQFLEEQNFSKNTEFYLCGNKVMVLGTQEFLKEKGINPKHVFMERFT